MGLSPADRYILDRRIHALVNSVLVEEHRRQPLGPHSPQLTEVLHFLRRSPDPDLPRYVVLRTRSPTGWVIGACAAGRGSRPRPIDSPRYLSRAEAEHAVFLRRLSDYGIEVAPDLVQRAGVEVGGGIEPAAPGIVGYVDTLSVAPGEALSLHVSTDAKRWSAQFGPPPVRRATTRRASTA